VNYAFKREIFLAFLKFVAIMNPNQIQMYCFLIDTSTFQSPDFWKSPPFTATVRLDFGGLTLTNVQHHQIRMQGQLTGTSSAGRT